MTGKSSGKDRIAVIIGAGPAGLTAGIELLDKTNIHPVIFEETGEIGGIARTIRFNSNLMDVGPHRFFSRHNKIMEWWDQMMPVQGHPAIDDKILNYKKNYKKNGPDPEDNNRVMLIRRRFTRILYLNKFFDYPINLRFQTFMNMGLFKAFKSGICYLWAFSRKRKENSLEDFYINRFGKPLYKMFFENYTQKVWGVHPSLFAAEWGSQRVRNITLLSAVRNMSVNSFNGDNNRDKANQFISRYFLYPKFGAGHMWETVAGEITDRGGEIFRNQKVKHINIVGNRIISVTVNKDGKEVTKSCDCLFSSMPLSELIPSLRGIDVPCNIMDIATRLPYRAHITACILVDQIIPQNNSGIDTINNRIPDQWIYIQEKEVKMGRLYIMNNFSPYMVEDFQNKLLLGIEYFCDEGDALWNMDEQSFISMAISELENIHFLKREDVLDSFQIKVKKAYPSYLGSYYQLNQVIDYLNGIENLYCIGRNGQHRYNNMDHSMLTAIEAVNHLSSNSSCDKSCIWNVNTEKDYHESR